MSNQIFPWSSDCCLDEPEKSWARYLQFAELQHTARPDLNYGRGTLIHPPQGRMLNFSGVRRQGTTKLRWSWFLLRMSAYEKAEKWEDAVAQAWMRVLRRRARALQPRSVGQQKMREDKCRSQWAFAQDNEFCKFFWAGGENACLACGAGRDHSQHCDKFLREGGMLGSRLGGASKPS